MQISLIATVFRIVPFISFRAEHRIAKRHDIVEPVQAATPPGDCAITRLADERLVRELGLWETFLHGGERPTLRR